MRDEWKWSIRRAGTDRLMRNGWSWERNDPGVAKLPANLAAAPPLCLILGQLHCLPARSSASLSIRPQAAATPAAQATAAREQAA